MKRLKFEYRTSVKFDGDVIDHGFLLRCLPKEEERQHLECYGMDIWPETEVKIRRRFLGKYDSSGFYCQTSLRLWV